MNRTLRLISNIADSNASMQKMGAPTFLIVRLNLISLLELKNRLTSDE